MEKMVSLDRAQEIIMAETAAISTETIEIRRANNRILAQDTPSYVSLPSARTSYRDGYALKSSDSGPGKKLKLSGKVFAGNPRTDPVENGEAVWIATGAVVPEDVDAVVDEEKVVVQGKTIELSEKVEPGQNLLAEAQEFAKGEVLLPKGTLLSSRELSLLIAGGYFEVEVIRKPRLWVLAVGDELRHPGTVTRPGQVYPSAGWLVAMRSEEMGCSLGRVLLAEDAPEALIEAIPGKAEADLVITVGGTGVGRKDIIVESLEQISARVVFQGVKIRPAHSTIFSKRDGQIIFSLPGRVSAAEIGFELMVRPAILKLQAKPAEEFTLISARTGKDLEGVKDHRHIYRGKLENKNGEFWVEPLRRKSWHHEIAEADGYIMVKENTKPAHVGDPVSFMMHPRRLAKFFPKP